MEYFDLIRNRVSVRDYDPKKKINKEQLLKIAEAGRLAPSAANKQPWRFIFVSSDEMLEKVRLCYGRQWFKNAPHILIVVGDKDLSWVRPTDGYNAIETDLTIAMDHMILAAESLDISTCWIAAFDNDILRTALRIPYNETIFCITPLGYPNDGYNKNKEKTRKPLSEIVEFI